MAPGARVPGGSGISPKRPAAGRSAAAFGLSHLWASRETRLGSGIVTKDTKGFGLPFYECAHGKLMDVLPSELPEKVERKTNKCR